MTSLLAARGLVKTYGSVRALDGVDVDVHAGDVIAVVGPSGSGKTTLLHVLSGIRTADLGDVFLDGAPIGVLSETRRSKLRRTSFGFVFQSGMLVAELSALENAALPSLLAGADRSSALSAASSWLDRLGLSGLGARRPGSLSGGQAQRVAIARALAHQPRVIFADEPTGALDSRTGQDMMTALLESAAASRAAVVVVTHDQAIAARADRVVEMRDGRIGVFA
ncbi:ABC transporter ATP-binding protein [Lentzea tibetensis]|uniref:ABC transporter ATP-binding protein n=1 Tax=Lentzea tibetensis TaxID=2591470 RepID=A0A563EMB0_9PSEU|nr:ABC transporter ATP-binding protein [Lentzea tibetensis]TWP48254.1 ABC transporter ATP-binding protein [Lentzea tibetensis]